MVGMSDKSGSAPMISAGADLWPEFRGSTENEHVEVGRMLVESVAGHFWQLGAIAASYADKFGGPDALKEWAKAVGVSTRRAQEWAYTWRAWRDRERSRILSFGHHTIAARASDPEHWISRAESEHLSQRALEARILDARAIAANSACTEPERFEVESPTGERFAIEVTRPAPEDAPTPTIEQQIESYRTCPTCSGSGVVTFSSCTPAEGYSPLASHGKKGKNVP